MNPGLVNPGLGRRMKANKKPKTEHWIYPRESQKGFWRNVQEWYGLDSDGVHHLLGIKSMYEFKGTEEEAYEAIEEAGGD